MTRIFPALLLALPALAADTVDEGPVATLSAAAQQVCAAGGGCLLLTREQLADYTREAVRAGVEMCSRRTRT